MTLGDDTIRAAAFAALSSIVDVHGQPLTWSQIAQGFSVGGEHLLFANRARGIFKPASMQRGVLSVKTTVPRVGRGARYADVHADDGSFSYKLQGGDPKSHDNRRLKEAFEDKSPIIYFYGVSETRYEAIWPAFITVWDPIGLSVQIEIGTGPTLGPAAAMPGEVERRYATRQTKQRLHQSAFREMVLDAYRDRCAFTGLPVRRLLHAAHIVPDVADDGIASVRNGIALSTIHHSAFDAHLIGITPDRIIKVSSRLMQVSDGPLLEHGLKSLNDSPLLTPTNQTNWPDRELLARRYEEYLNVN